MGNILGYFSVSAIQDAEINTNVKPIPNLLCYEKLMSKNSVFLKLTILPTHLNIYVHHQYIDIIIHQKVSMDTPNIPTSKDL